MAPIEEYFSKDSKVLSHVMILSKVTVLDVKTFINMSLRMWIPYVLKLVEQKNNDTAVNKTSFLLLELTF